MLSKESELEMGRAKNSIERGQDECSDVHHVVSGCSVLGAASMSINARVYVHSTGGTTNRGTGPCNDGSWRPFRANNDRNLDPEAFTAGPDF